MSLIECYLTLQNSRVIAFTVLELLRENQLVVVVVGGNYPLPQTQIRVNRILPTWCWVNTKISIGLGIPSACTQIFPSIRRVNFIADE